MTRIRITYSKRKQFCGMILGNMCAISLICQLGPEVDQGK